MVCDNDGYAVIHRLQTGQGAAGFNNMFADSRGPRRGRRPDRRLRRARALAGLRRRGGRRRRRSPDLAAAYPRAREAAVAEQRPAVVVCRVHPSSWTESGAWWETGTPASLSGRASYDEGKTHQVRWV